MRKKIFLLCFILSFVSDLSAQITERTKPKEWKNLVAGGRFMDFFKPMPILDQLTKNTWGASNVIPRDITNGIEDSEWSYWGGNIKQDSDGKYHLFVARWPEDSPKGHQEWPNSSVVRAVSDHSIGPYKVAEVIGNGHNPELFKSKGGKYVIYAIDKYYSSKNIEGPWTKGTFDFDPRGRAIIEGLSNLTFAQREDGSYLMICRGGGAWISKTGLSTFKQISLESTYPPVDGRFEDPVVWRDHIQYHMIVNDWLGRIAYYLRSKDGIQWKVDPGEAYMPGIAQHEDGTLEDWFKYERIKILQDSLGRAIQANFAVIDVQKSDDRQNDNHSSKNISIPLIVGRQLEVLNTQKIDKNTSEIRLKLKAEKGFDPHKDVDINSFRFGAPSEVDFGRGSTIKTVEESGADVILTFEGKNNGFSEEHFAGKLLGKRNDGKLLFGYCRLPQVVYITPIVSAARPVLNKKANGSEVSIDLENFGQVRSKPSSLIIKYQGKNNVYSTLAKTRIKGIQPYEQINIAIPVSNKEIDTIKMNILEVVVLINGEEQTAYKGKIKIAD